MPRLYRGEAMYSKRGAQIVQHSRGKWPSCRRRVGSNRVLKQIQTAKLQSDSGKECFVFCSWELVVHFHAHCYEILLESSVSTIFHQRAFLALNDPAYRLKWSMASKQEVEGEVARYDDYCLA